MIAVFLKTWLFVAPTVALNGHDDAAHDDVHTACHEAVQPIWNCV